MRKLTYSILFLITILFLGCNSKDKSIQIRGTIHGSNDSILYVISPIKGVYFHGNEKTIRIDSSKTFLYDLENIRIGETVISIKWDEKCRLFLMPGDRADVIITKSGDKYSYNFKGSNSIGQAYINTFQRNWYFDLENISDTVAFQLLKDDNRNKVRETQGLDSLYNSKKINEEFYKYTINEINYYYASRTALVTSAVDSLKTRNYNESIKQLRNETYDKYLIASSEGINTCWWYDYTDNFIVYNELHKKGEYPLQTERIQESSQYFSGKYLEAYNATTLFIIASARINKDYLELYDNFVEAFPTSTFLPFLDKALAPTKTLYKNIEEKNIDTSLLISDYSNINSLTKLVEKYKGSKLYIDVWATWCGPCREELKHNKELKSLLLKYDYNLVYISIDFEEQEKLWKDMILYYGLEGKNLRANENLRQDLIELNSDNGYYSIPWHIIFDKNGKLIEKDASGILDLDSLEKQLQKQ